MISEAVEREVEHLLKTEGMSQREIARRTGVSRQVVGRVKNGKLVGIREVMRRKLEVSLVEMRDVTGGRVNRCSTCGAMVYGECRECLLKKAKRNGELTQVYDGSGGSLDSDLSDEEASRLEEIREAMRN